MSLTKNLNDVSWPFYHHVPVERKANLNYRKGLYQRCARDREFRQGIIGACAQDTLFFYRAFLWLYEPREGMAYGSGKLPFVPWPHQEHALWILDRFWGVEDLRFWKSRGEGATWLVVMRVFKDWLFDPRYRPGAFGLVSRNEDTVDSPDDPDSLLWKADWQIKQLPKWMVPGAREYSRTRSTHSFLNYRNDATIVGYSATEDVGSGGRKRVFVMDELAKFAAMRKGADQAAMDSTGPVTECRVIISTPKGTGNAYYDAIVADVDIDKFVATRDPISESGRAELDELGVVVLHWSDNPFRNRELFFVNEQGELKDADPETYGQLSSEYRRQWPEIRTLLERKGFRVLGTMRSPWYDRQCLRPNATPQSVAQEYDLDFGGSGYSLFTADTIAVAKRALREPLYYFTVDYSAYDLAPEFIEHTHGRLKVWLPLLPDTKTPPLEGNYVLGADIASGLGGSQHSNSVACVLDLDTGEQVAEWASNAVKPEEFADICISIGKWFNYAEIIPEANGPFGKSYIMQLNRREYGRIYRREEVGKATHKRGQEYGWGSSKDSKSTMLSALDNKIRTALIRPRSRAAVEEMKHWVMEGGRVVQAQAVNTEDETSQNEAHGDRVIAMGVAALRYEPDITAPAVTQENKPEPVVLHPETMAYRLKMQENQKTFENGLDFE